MSLTGAWAKLQVQMEMDMIQANFHTQQKILEIHKSIAYRTMIRTKELTQQQAKFIFTLSMWLKQHYTKDSDTTIGNRDIPYYVSMLEKIQTIGEYTLEEADLLTLLTTLYKDEK